MFQDSSPMFHPMMLTYGSGSSIMSPSKPILPRGGSLDGIAKHNLESILQDRLKVLNYLKDVHTGKQEWLNTGSTVYPDEWEVRYGRREGIKSYFALGAALCIVADRTFTSLTEYAFAVLTVIQYYDAYDNRKKLKKEKAAGATKSQTNLMKSGSDKDSISVSYTGSSSSSNGSQPPASPTKSFNRFFKRGKLKRAQSVQSLASKYAPSELSNSSSSLDDGATITSMAPMAATPTNRYSSTVPPLKKGPKQASLLSRKLPNSISKNPAATELLASLTVPNDDDIPYLPDAYQSYMTLLDTLYIIYYRLSSQCKSRKIDVNELMNLETYVRTMDEIVRKLMVSETIINVWESDKFTRDSEIQWIEREIVKRTGQ
uniref:ARAD1C39248p n=1 Tax=Blastobotrys adeninivorans TaxID=409370 RepID=A0A060T8T2_BLAAD